MPVKDDQAVYYCHLCGTDLRLKNVDFHKDAGHDVRKYDHDPRDKRFEAVELCQ